MRQICRKIGSLIMGTMLAVSLAIPAKAVDQTATAPYIQRMISYYLHHQEAAQENIDDLLAQIAAIDPRQGKVWENIMDTWAYTNTEMPVFTGVLPDGLPQDDTLCIVVMGYDLEDNGAMKPELLDRLEVALASAQKYPNAFVAVTGGETSDVAGVTEAGQMADWLKANGIAPERLIVEPNSLSTTANAMNVYDILTASYPQVISVAVVSSDYHIPWGCMMFSTVSEYAYNYQNKPYLEVVGNASCATSTSSDTLYSQAWGISVIAGVSFDGNAVPALYMPRETTVPTTQPAVAEKVAEETDSSWMYLAGGMVVLAVVILFIPTKKKREEEPRQRTGRK